MTSKFLNSLELRNLGVNATCSNVCEYSSLTAQPLPVDFSHDWPVSKQFRKDEIIYTIMFDHVILSLEEERTKVQDSEIKSLGCISPMLGPWWIFPPSKADTRRSIMA
jgi:hypothetical protein